MGQGKRSICFAGALRLRTAQWAAVAALPFAAAGCRVNEGDVKRWEQTQRGPYKLVAVITHDKYPMELRTDAALSLIRMPPRGGAAAGDQLLDREVQGRGEEREGALNQLSPDTRQQLVDKMVPLLMEELKPPPPARTPEGRLRRIRRSRSRTRRSRC